MTVAGAHDSTRKPLGATSTPSSSSRLRLTSTLHLGLLLAAEEAQLKRFRSLHISSTFLAVSAIIGVALCAWAGASDVADVVALRLLAYAAWLYGLVGLPVLMKPAASGLRPQGLAELRGVRVQNFHFRTLGRAIYLFFGLCLAALPGLVAATLVSPTGSSLAQRFGLVLVAILYLLVLAATFAAVAWLAERTAPGWPRLFAMTVFLVPWLLSFVWPTFPNLISAFAWGLSAMIDWGAMV